MKKIQPDLKETEIWASAQLVSIKASKSKELLMLKVQNIIAYPDFIFKGEAKKRLDARRFLESTFLQISHGLTISVM